jgi:mannosyltransferase OCH1-like enzyme/predicted O-methyltransferase YrrM
MQARTIAAIDRALLPAGDYVSAGLEVIWPDWCFPQKMVGNPAGHRWPFLRRHVPHNWYVDRRWPTAGWLTRDEASLLYNNARQFAGKPALEIGCFCGWSTCHLALAGVQLDALGPLQGRPEFAEAVRTSLQAAGVLERVNLHAGQGCARIDELSRQSSKPWSLFFIDPDHAGFTPREAAKACAAHAADDAMILFHDAACPDVLRALVHLRDAGWQIIIYQTMQIVAAAWRGNVRPVSHRPDPSVVWSLPEHLREFEVSGCPNPVVGMEQPDDASSLFNLGSIYFDLKRPGEALRVLLRSLEKPDASGSILPQCFALVARCYREAGQGGEALRWCLDGRQHFPDEVELALVEAELRLAHNDQAGAEACLKQFLKSQSPVRSADASTVAAVSRIGQMLTALYVSQHRYADAEALWKTALKQTPGNLQAHAALGEVYLQTEQWGQVSNNVDAMMRLGPAGAEEAAVQAGRMQMRQNLFDAARVHLSTAARRFPQSQRLKEMIAEEKQIRLWRSNSSLLATSLTAAGASAKIPRILHQVWLGGAPLDSVARDWQRKLRELHPAWEYRLWTDETIRQLPIAELLPLCRSPSSASNVVRLAAIAIFGGVYLDCDCEPLRPLNDLLDCGAFAAPEEQDSLCNAVFGAAAGHSWIQWQIINLPHYVSRDPPWGPKLMSAAPRDGLTIMPTTYFYPFLWRTPQAMRRAAPETYVIHHWNLSWQANHPSCMS